MSSQGGQGGAGAQQGAPPGPPYAPQTWSLGGRLEESVDIPITAVFLALFIMGAISHMATFQRNRKRGHKFLLSLFLFGFCMCRVVTCVLRIASSTRPKNIQLAIAAQIFVAAGVLVIYVMNLVFAQRLIRAQHPRLGWSFRFGMFFKLTYVVTILTLIMVITVTVQSFYTLSTNTKRIDRDIQLYCSTFFAYVSFLPAPLTLLGFALPRRKPIEKFGSGRWRTKRLVLLTGTFILCLGATYRCATAYLDPVPMTKPLPSYYSKACFYVFNFTLEIIVVFLYLVVRVDKRFHIPNGARGPGQYARGPYAPKTIDPKRTAEQTKKYDSMQTLGKASTIDEYDPTTPRKLNLKTDFSPAEKRKIDLEAQSDAHSAISGTTAALSKDHLLLPESPKAVHLKSDKYRNNADIPPVPALPPSAVGAISSSSTYLPHPAAGAAAPARAADDKLDRVVDLLVSLDHRLSNLETAPRRDDLLERLTQRLAGLDEAGDATPRMRPQSSSETTLRGSVGNDGAALSLLDRLDRRLSRLEEHEARINRQNTGLESLMAMERRLSYMESRMGSPNLQATEFDNMMAFSPRLRGGAASPPPRFTQLSPRMSFRATGLGTDAWPLDEVQEQRQQLQQQSQSHPGPLRPGFYRTGPSAGSIGTTTLNIASINGTDENDDDGDDYINGNRFPAPPAVTAAADIGRAYTPDDDSPHQFGEGSATPGVGGGTDAAMLGVAREQPLRYSTSAASAATSRYSQATEIDLGGSEHERERPRTAYVVEDLSNAAQLRDPHVDDGRRSL